MTTQGGAHHGPRSDVVSSRPTMTPPPRISSTLVAGLLLVATAFCGGICGLQQGCC